MSRGFRQAALDFVDGIPDYKLLSPLPTSTGFRIHEDRNFRLDMQTVG
jgi:hypothetical protein